MALDLTILKEEHAGIERARKVLPHIQNCDVYGKENGFCSLEEARALEEGWMARLKLTKTQFLQRERGAERMGAPAVDEYIAKINEYLFRNNKPVYFIERFTNENSKNLREEAFRSAQDEYEMVKLLASGQVDNFLEAYSKENSKLVYWCDLRDRNMAASLENAEQDIRQRFPSLKDKPTIKLVAAMGGGHEPEKYLSIPCKVVNLYTFSFISSLSHKTFVDFRDTGNFQKRDALAYGIARIQQGFKLGFSEKELRELDEKQIRDLFAERFKDEWRS